MRGASPWQCQRVAPAALMALCARLLGVAGSPSPSDLRMAKPSCNVLHQQHFDIQWSHYLHFEAHTYMPHVPWLSCPNPSNMLPTGHS